MTTVYLVRHGTTAHTSTRLVGRTPGVGLDDDGRAQAAAVAERLKTTRIAAIYSSPLERTMETAHAIAQSTNCDVEAVSDLIEVDYGSWTNRPYKSLMRTKLWTKVQQWPSAVRFPGGETIAEVQARSVRGLDEICARHPKGSVCCVTHAEVIRLLAAHYLGVHIDHFQRIVIAPASLSVLSISPSGPRVLALNTIPYALDGKRESRG